MMLVGSCVDRFQDMALQFKPGRTVDKLFSLGQKKGAITLQNFRMRYRNDTPFVLKDLNLSIAGGERVGIVARTGSGKSSLILALLRLVEPTLSDDVNESYIVPILIDGIDVIQIGIYELRSKVGIIPQNPIPFSGTIMSNMDPFDQYSDREIWNALDKCCMTKSVEGMDGKL